MTTKSIGASDDRPTCFRPKREKKKLFKNIIVKNTQKWIFLDRLNTQTAIIIIYMRCVEWNQGRQPWSASSSSCILFHSFIHSFIVTNSDDPYFSSFQQSIVREKNQKEVSSDSFVGYRLYIQETTKMIYYIETHRKKISRWIMMCNLNNIF